MMHNRTIINIYMQKKYTSHTSYELSHEQGEKDRDAMDKAPDQ